jgi:hypothetical protein
MSTQKRADLPSKRQVVAVPPGAVRGPPHPWRRRSPSLMPRRPVVVRSCLPPVGEVQPVPERFGTKRPWVQIPPPRPRLVQVRGRFSTNRDRPPDRLSAGSRQSMRDRLVSCDDARIRPACAHLMLQRQSVQGRPGRGRPRMRGPGPFDPFNQPGGNPADRCRALPSEFQPAGVAVLRPGRSRVLNARVPPPPGRGTGSAHRVRDGIPGPPAARAAATCSARNWSTSSSSSARTRCRRSASVGLWMAPWAAHRGGVA